MRVLKVSSGDDYAALQFENAYGGTSVKEIIENLDKYSSDETEDEGWWELSVFEVGEVSEEFLKFIRFHIQDHDDSKHTQFYMENEKIST